MISLNTEVQLGQQVLISGQCLDENPAAATVTFSGVVNGTATIDGDGYFSYLGTADSLGEVMAVVTDDEGLASDPSAVSVTSAAPSIAINVDPAGNSTQVHVWGWVTDENPGGLSVALGGVVSGSVATNSDGSFDAIVSAASLGSITATVSDVWGQTGSGGTELSAAVPSLTLQAAETGNGNQVHVWGTLSAVHPEGMSVSISGVANGTLTPNADGSFDGWFDAAQLGEIYASTVDVWGRSTSTSTTLSSAAPALAIYAAPTGTGRQVHLWGSIADEASAGLTVSFSGVANGSIVTNSDGSFDCVVDAQSVGTISASTTDRWGQSNSNSVELAVSPPSISLNVATTGYGTQLHLWGTVTADSPSGLGVQLWGVANGWISTNPDGSFDTTIEASALGNIAASAIDVWGNFTMTSIDVTNSAPSLNLYVSPTGNGTQVHVWGNVADDDPAWLDVAIAGVINGNLTTSYDGSFAGYFDAASLGSVMVAVTDRWGQAAMASALVESAQPTLNLYATPTGYGTQVHLWGNITGIQLAGVTVSLAGIINNSVVTDGNGNFDLTIDASSLGQLSATITNAWGQTASASIDVVEADPTITVNAQLTGSGGEVVISGNFSNAAFTPIYLVVSGVASTSVWTDYLGNFFTYVDASALGTITVMGADRWGRVASNSTEITASHPTITLATSMAGSGTLVNVSGNLTGVAAGTVVHLNGVINADVVTDANGDFTATLAANGQGTVTATGSNHWGQTATASATVVSMVPSIFVYAEVTGEGRDVRIWGQVCCDSPGGVEVNLSGVVGGAVTTDATGAFSTTLTASSLGAINVSMTDVWSQSASSSVIVSCAPPEISQVTVCRNPSGLWAIDGTISSPFPASVVVTLEGDSTTYAVDSSGRFSIGVSDNGESFRSVSLVATDVWNQSSAAAIVALA